MPQITQIQVTATDNELYILVLGVENTSEICHLKSGNFRSVDYIISPQAILPPGAYTLIFIGINWGGPCIFTVVLTPSTGTPITVSGGSGLPTGGVWSKAMAITV
jgi:hypothetical protein